MKGRSIVERITRGSSAARDGPRRVGPHLVWVLLLALLPAACIDQLEFAPVAQFSCSEVRLNAAAGFYEEAKEQLELHFTERPNNSLVFAYYLSLDSEELAKTIRACPDFRRNKERAIDLIRANLVFRRVLLVNMRDSDPFVMINILGYKYDEVFRSDIH